MVTLHILPSLTLFNCCLFEGFHAKRWIVQCLYITLNIAQEISTEIQKETKEARKEGDENTILQQNVIQKEI